MKKDKKGNLTISQMDNTIATRDRIVAWPRMGNIDLSMEALVSSLGAKIVMPPPNTNEALEIGVKNSIEGICLPYKLNLANYIMALEKGANTLMMFQAPGSCRFGTIVSYSGRLCRIFSVFFPDRIITGKGQIASARASR